METFAQKIEQKVERKRNMENMWKYSNMLHIIVFHHFNRNDILKKNQEIKHNNNNNKNGHTRVCCHVLLSFFIFDHDFFVFLLIFL